MSDQEFLSMYGQADDGFVPTPVEAETADEWDESDPDLAVHDDGDHEGHDSGDGTDRDDDLDTAAIGAVAADRGDLTVDGSASAIDGTTVDGAPVDGAPVDGAPVDRAAWATAVLAEAQSDEDDEFADDDSDDDSDDDDSHDDDGLDVAAKTRLDEALRQIDVMFGRPPAEQVTTYTQAHQTLQSTLARIDND